MTAALPMNQRETLERRSLMEILHHKFVNDEVILIAPIELNTVPRRRSYRPPARPPVRPVIPIPGRRRNA